MAAQSPAPDAPPPALPHPDGLLGVLRTLPPDTLAGSLWGGLDGASRRAFRASCREADAWARSALLTGHATVQLNAHYLEALGCSGRPLLEHLPELRSLTLRQATAGRKPLPAEVVAACLDLLAAPSPSPSPSSPPPGQLQQSQQLQQDQQQTEGTGAAEPESAEGALGSHAALHDGCGNGSRGGAAARGGLRVRRLALVGWPSLEVSQLGLMADAMPRLEELELVCRTRAFPHNFVAPAELLPALPVLLPRLRHLRLAGLGLQHHCATTAAGAAAAAVSAPRPAAAAAAAAQTATGGPCCSPALLQTPADCAIASATTGHAGLGGGTAAPPPPPPPPTPPAGAAAAPAGLAALAQLRVLTRLQLSTVDLPRSLAAQLGSLTQLRELDLELWLVMTPADELRGWARAVGRGVGALAAAAAAATTEAAAAASSSGERRRPGEALPGRLHSLRLALRNCVEEVASDEEGEQAGEDRGHGEEEMEAEAEAGQVGRRHGHVAQPSGGGGGLMAALLAAMATATERTRQRHRPAHQHQHHQHSRTGPTVCRVHGLDGGGSGTRSSGLQLLQLPGHQLCSADWLQLTRLQGLRRVEVAALEPGFAPWGGALACERGAPMWGLWRAGQANGAGFAGGAAAAAESVGAHHSCHFELAFVEEEEDDGEED
ncbi:hypothetical protein HYH02_004109 [Chlamydomonas schloesseri]|uniref:Uncharacterized protein n=1 Tax=Chlamydomonas schloesseri TaxID=2026947 RepID=A0A835WQ15_9CHLO|nr:hypothetical protein HYH02_004109 [Chlamydomonas schloesseri]|eukprot:KAG2451511.1 hypothetical protein HYH02_004109 [Chlamydomonas schloesseri]